jgi:putative CocE/NonD family hydrolase
LPEASVFETGANHWRTFDHWPPRTTEEKALYFSGSGRLTFDAPEEAGDASDEFISDPSKPVPFTDVISTQMTQEYMTDDQRFAARRPDVLVYQTDVLKDDVTLAGPLQANLWVSTSGTDSDWIVKLIDVYPDDHPDSSPNPTGVHLGGYQQLVRGEVMRGRFRNSFEKPEPFTPGKPNAVKFKLPDVCHTFQKGHRIMVQIQSTWFPLVARNPQKYLPNYKLGSNADFQKATERVYHTAAYPSRIVLPVLKR